MNGRILKKYSSIPGIGFTGLRIGIIVVSLRMYIEPPDFISYGVNYNETYL